MNRSLYISLPIDRACAAIAPAASAVSGRPTSGAVADMNAALKIRDALRGEGGGGEAAAAAHRHRLGHAQGPVHLRRRPPEMPPYDVSTRITARAHPAASRRCRSCWWSTPPPRASPTSSSTPATCRACTTTRGRAPTRSMFDQKECVFLTHVFGVTRRPAGGDQEQRPRGPQHEHRRPEQLQSDDSRRRRRAVDGAARGSDAAGRQVQHPPVDDRPTCCRGRTATSR